MNDSQYRTIRVSDLVRDGMVLELWYEGDAVGQEVAEIFYSDVTNKFTISLFETELPLQLVEGLIAEAKIKITS